MVGFLLSSPINNYKSNKVSKQLNDADKFLIFHSNPTEVRKNQLSEINSLIDKYPYCQSLHFLSAKAASEILEKPHYLTNAAAFASSREVLFNFLENTQSFTSSINEELDIVNPIKQNETINKDFGQAFGVDLNQMIIKEQPLETEKANNLEQENEVDVIPDESKELKISSENNQALADNDIEVSNHEQLAEKIEEENEILQRVENVGIENENLLEEEKDQAFADVEQHEVIVDETPKEISEIANKYDNDLVEELNNEFEENLEDINETESKVFSDDNKASENVEQSSAEANKYENDLLEEVPNETDEKQRFLNEEENPQTSKVKQSEDIEHQIEEEIVAVENKIESVENNNESIKTEQTKPKRKSLEEILFDSPVQSDFFAFTKEKQKDKEIIRENIKEEEKAAAVSQYNDDSLPYTFLWWLNKTRKEHSLNNNQPYVATKPVQQKGGNKAFSTDPLNHQIAENIFHLRSVEDVEKNKQNANFTIPYDFRQKEHKIIEKFIKEEPQIKPPAANKIDTENKAKKSSEDTNEVVSETLAKIYIEQMLYHKALDVYKKLSLKYPEKSTYFASQIKYLELKVN